MKTTREELIDFYDWVWDNDLINDPRETEQIVDEYFTTIEECKCNFAMIRRDQKTQKAYCFQCKKLILE